MPAGRVAQGFTRDDCKVLDSLVFWHFSSLLFFPSLLYVKSYQNLGRSEQHAHEEEEKKRNK